MSGLDKIALDNITKLQEIKNIISTVPNLLEMFNETPNGKKLLDILNEIDKITSKAILDKTKINTKYDDKGCNVDNIEI